MGVAAAVFVFVVIDDSRQRRLRLEKRVLGRRARGPVAVFQLKHHSRIGMRGREHFLAREKRGKERERESLSPLSTSRRKKKSEPKKKIHFPTRHSVFCTMTMQTLLPRGAAAASIGAARVSMDVPSRSLSVYAKTHAQITQQRRRPSRSCRRSIDVAAASSSPQPPPPSPKIDDPAASLAPLLRAAPLYLAVGGVASVLINRFLFSSGGNSSSTSAVSLDAASAQSRAELLAVALSAVLALTGLQWLTIAPKTPEPATLEGFEVLDWIVEGFPERAAGEVRWLREAAPSCVALAAFVDGECVAKIGAFLKSSNSGSSPPPPPPPPSLPAFGDVCSRAAESQRGTYLANLELYPGRGEFLCFLPRGTKGVAVAPAGRVLLVAATNVVRGFAAVDQAWVATVAEKVDSSVDGWREKEK